MFISRQIALARFLHSIGRSSDCTSADLTREIAIANLYGENPNYFNNQMSLANANAIKQSDKLILTPEGVFPQLIFGSGILPSVPFGPPASETPAP